MSTTGVTPAPVVLGVRHHGPGSARSVVEALDAADPQILLVEGPADADSLLGWVGDGGLEPPVALLAYETARPERSAFWPFAVFSPEWQAMRWAAARGVEVRFCDLPAAASLTSTGPPADPACIDVGDEPDEPGDAPPPPPRDPLGDLAEAGGYEDPERWWEHLVELRDGAAPFDLIADAMSELRLARPDGDPREAAREAAMRLAIRAARKDGHDRIAVVCGAWHAPALREPFPSAARDAALVREIPKAKVTLTWVPWTYGRLARESGYGAGITAPGWYHHLFATPHDAAVVTWLTSAAREMRRQDLPISTAHVIEAARLADALATMGERPTASLADVMAATLAVLCDGDDARLTAVAPSLLLGDRLGAVPDGVPTVPLEADLAATTRRLRLTRRADETVVDLDLRTPTGLDRSLLLHRLRLLGIGWGTQIDSGVRSTGTFRESWRLQWDPALAVAVVEASMWGTTVADAARARLASASPSDGLRELAAAVAAALRADLPEALPALLAAVDEAAATGSDVGVLADAVPDLVDALRYGDVRGTSTGGLATVVETIVARLCAGMPAAVTALDDDAAGALATRLTRVDTAVRLLSQPATDEGWTVALIAAADRADVHGVVAGRCVRLLWAGGRLAAEDVAGRLSIALSIGAGPAAAAGWVEGLLTDGGVLLAHDLVLLGVIDVWLTSLSAEQFLDVLPLLRRTTGTIPPGERRAVAAAVRRLGTASSDADGTDDEPIDDARADAATATVLTLLGWT